MLESGNIFDVQADKWHVYETKALFGKVENLDGADGGLVCCVSKWKWRDNNPGFFIVMNPLTKQKTQLPPLLSMGAEKSNFLVTVLKMVKLTVDRKTEYKFFVVGSIENGGRDFFAQVYDSHIKEWTIVEATQGHITGWDNFDFDHNLLFCLTFCVYNCADGTLQHFNITLELLAEPGGCVLLEDHLFVLHKEASLGFANLLEEDVSMVSKYCITEFHLPEKSTAWVKLGVRSCGPCTCFYDSQHFIMNLRLWGCKEFLLEYGHCSKRAWLYNLPTCEWPFQPSETL